MIRRRTAELHSARARRRGRVVTPVLVAGSLLAFAAAPAAAVTSPSPSVGTEEDVTLYVPSPDPAGLRALAQAAPTVARSDRLARLATLLPRASARDDVAARARALGLTVTGQSTWDVQVRGPATLVRSLFGSARSVRPTSPIAQALPTIPPSLTGRVTAALGGDEVRSGLKHPVADPATTPIAAPAAIPAVGFTGPQLRSAYQTSLAAGTTPTVATLQLSGWNAANLSTYAAAAGLPNPLTSGQYTAVSVDGANPATVDGTNDQEVALDQESLLGVAPTARQRMYVAPNTDASYLDILDRVRQDATTNPSIMALSISWGACEPDWSPTVVNQAETEFAALAAAGVTTFAAAGDSGAYDCTGDDTNHANSPAVDYPASSPNVVGVGGTTLRLGPPASETAWSGSGGGCSTLFARPAWQPAVATCAGKRAVPDISADANPQTGFAVYLGGWVEIGGTSLGAPSSAAALADEWQRNRLTTGFGDIHSRVYGAPTTAFRDVRSGSNGYPATTGYDLVTGRGSPLWDVLAGSLTPGGSPPVSGPTPTPTPTPTRTRGGGR